MQILKKFITFGIPIILGLSLISTDTFSLFTSSKTINGNTFTAGSLKINIVDKQSPNKLLSDTIPVNFGKNGQDDINTTTYIVKNAGTLDAYYHIKLEDFQISIQNKNDLYYLTNKDGSAYAQGTPSYSTVKDYWKKSNDGLSFTIKSGSTTLFEIKQKDITQITNLGKWYRLPVNSGQEEITVSITVPKNQSIQGTIHFEPIIERNNSFNEDNTRK